MRWVHRYSPIIEARLKKHIRLTNDSWRMDENYIRIKGENASTTVYLHRDIEGLRQCALDVFDRLRVLFFL